MDGRSRRAIKSTVHSDSIAYLFSFLSLKLFGHKTNKQTQTHTALSWSLSSRRCCCWLGSIYRTVPYTARNCNNCTVQYWITVQCFYLQSVGDLYCVFGTRLYCTVRQAYHVGNTWRALSVLYCTQCCTVLLYSYSSRAVSSLRETVQLRILMTHTQGSRYCTVQYATVDGRRVADFADFRFRKW